MIFEKLCVSTKAQLLDYIQPHILTENSMNKLFFFSCVCSYSLQVNVMTAFEISLGFSFMTIVLCLIVMLTQLRRLYVFISNQMKNLSEDACSKSKY
jgi:hypothetical protein